MEKENSNVTFEILGKHTVGFKYFDLSDHEIYN
ncbi:hypothetical protein HDC91_002909 [Mucilaginibacter sp. AK015]|nr:hypothetical protein [Mucilaginibacter sp. AK015]